VLPLIVVAASDDSGQGAPPGNRSLRDQLVEVLRHRYNRDYEVVGSDPEQVTGLLQEMSTSARPVAAVIAGSDQEAGAKAAVQLLAQVRATSAKPDGKGPDPQPAPPLQSSGVNTTGAVMLFATSLPGSKFRNSSSRLEVPPPSTLARVGQDGSVLPVLIHYSGEVLVDPTDSDLVELMGFKRAPTHSASLRAVRGRIRLIRGPANCDR
jgi:hypothetical protein